jgi:hypothetical protein
LFVMFELVMSKAFAAANLSFFMISWHKQSIFPFKDPWLFMKMFQLRRELICSLRAFVLNYIP